MWVRRSVDDGFVITKTAQPLETTKTNSLSCNFCRSTMHFTLDVSKLIRTKEVKDVDTSQ